MGKRNHKLKQPPQARRLLLELLEDRRLLTDVSAPAILQWFESSYDTIEQRVPDLFMAGYGAVWTPPPSRGDTSDLTVGYDVYDRFDLGYAGKPTLYGTETGLKTLTDRLHTAGLSSHVDFVLNHNGYSTLATEGFYEAGGYPGLAITLPNDIDGDFHSAFWGGVEYERLAGLIDIAQEKNHQFIRSPVDPNDSRNIRAGTTPAFGRLANVADPNNHRFYPDNGHNTIYVYDPKTGEENIPVHQFNLDDPLAGDPTVENATGYLMRNAQWLIQDIGIDGLRIDAAKHVQGFTLDFLDRAVYRQNPRPLLDGSTQHVFTYSEVYDANPAVLHPHVKKDIDPSDLGRIGGNRDTLDFKLYFALKENLEYGTQPGWDNWNSNRGAWYQIKDAALDTSPANGQGDTLHNGNAGVTFVQSHDVYKPYQLENVAHAYTLMMPGNSVVYFNGKEFGDNRDFPKAGRADALSVANGSDLTRILNARNSHGRGNYAERWVDDQGLFAFEREASALVLLSNRTDGGFDSRTLTQVGFAPGTYLVELTGNAADAQRDPYNDIPEVIQVFEEEGVNKVNARFARNANADGDWTGGGYLIYGLPTPQAPAGLELLGVTTVMAGNANVGNDYENGTQRQTDVYVVTGDQLPVRLQTVPVNLLGSMRDPWADGDNALLKLDDGRPINNLNPHNTPSGVDFDEPGSVIYGFEQFEQKSSPFVGPGGLNDDQWQGNGEFLQTIDLTQLKEGMHFLEARAFRHRTDEGPANYSSFKKVFYVDRLPPDSTVDSFEPWDSNVQENRDLIIRSLDKTADNVHVFLNLPAGLSDEQVMAKVNHGEGKADSYDRDLFKYGYFNVPHGNNVVTIVSFEPTGNSQIQRVPGLFTSTIVGAGLGDLNHDSQYNETDVQTFATLMASNQGQFNPAADFNADGLITYIDLVSLIAKLQQVNASPATLAAVSQLQGQWFGATDDAYEVSEDAILEIDPTGILTNDRHPGADGALNLETAGEVETALGGTATFEANGKLRYVPPASMQSLGRGESQSDSVGYTVNDGLGTTDQGTITFTVTGNNDAPSLTAANTFSLNEDTDAFLNGITVNDIDAGNSSLRVTISATHSTVTLSETSGLTFLEGDGNLDSRVVFEGSLEEINEVIGSIKLRGNQDYFGADLLSVLVDDRSNPGSSDPQTDSHGISLTINPINDTPLANDITYQVPENIPFEKEKEEGLTTLATDVDGDPLTFTVVTAPSHGQLVLNADGSYTHTSDTNYNLTDVFTYRANDGTVNSNIGTVTLEIIPLFPHYNCLLRWDVNGDSWITPLDVVTLLNLLNDVGAHQLSSTRGEGVIKPFLDVSRDGTVSELDVSLVVNRLNAGADGETSEAEGEAPPASFYLGSKLLADEQPLLNRQQINRQPLSSSSTDPLSRPLLDNRSYWQQVDETFSRLGRRDSWFEPNQSSDEEADWWNFLDEKTGF